MEQERATAVQVGLLKELSTSASSASHILLLLVFHPPSVAAA